MPARLCLVYGPKCSNNGRAVPGTSRCPAHSRGWRKTPQMQARGAFYTTRSWRERSKRQLAEHPECVACGRPAQVADHVDNIGAGGDWFGPLQSLCRPCHDKKTASEGGKAAKANREAGRGRR